MRFLLTLFTLLFFVFNALAKPVYVAPVQGTNLPDSQTKTVRELIKAQVQNKSDHTLVHQIDKAKTYIQTKVIKFDSYTLSLTLWEGNIKKANGQWRAKNLSELEAKIIAGVSEVLSGSSQQNASLPSAKNSLSEQAEAKKQRSQFERVQAPRQAIIGFGPAYFGGMNAADSGIGFTAGYVWNIDDRFDLGLQSDFTMSTEHSDIYMFDGKILTNYHFLAQDISPFIGAGFGYAWASVHDNNIIIDDNTPSGFAISLQAGVKFFRTSSVNFALSGEYTQIFANTTLGTPSTLLIKVALYY